MKTLHVINSLGMAILLSVSTSALGQGKPDPALAPIKDDPRLPRVLLIGDSISIGYTVPVRELLKGKANVHRIPDNGGPTTNGIKNLESWLGEDKWDVIHFNWGLHDIKLDRDGKHQVAIEDYEKNLFTLVGKLKATGARLIWASTTPVPEGKLSPLRKPGDEVAYNAAAKKLMDKYELTINDLHSFALPRLKEIQLPANVHFSNDGSKILAKRVAESIEAALAEAREENEAAAALGKIKGIDVPRSYWNGRRVVGIRINYRFREKPDEPIRPEPYTDAELAPLKRLKHLDQVVINAHVSEKSLAFLQGQTRLQELELISTGTGDGALQYVRGLVKLRKLNLAATHVRGPGLAHLRGLTALVQLNLAGTDVTDEGLKHLPPSDRVRWVNVTKTK